MIAFWKDYDHILDTKNPTFFLNASWWRTATYKCFLVLFVFLANLMNQVKVYLVPRISTVSKNTKYEILRLVLAIGMLFCFQEKKNVNIQATWKF